MKFINTIKSLTSKHFYDFVSKESSKNAWKFFIKSVFLVGAIILVVGAIEIVPLFRVINDPQLSTKISSVYPKDLVLKINSGKLSTNVQEPYSIPITNLSSVFPDISEISPLYNNIITINTNSDFSMEEYIKSKSVIYLTKDYFVFNDNNSVKFESYRGFKDGELNYQSFYELADIFSKVVRKLVFFATVPLAIAFILLYTISNIIFLSFATLIIWLIHKFSKNEIMYSKLFKQGLYLMFLVIVLDLLLSVINLHSITISFVIYLLAYYYIIGKNK